jgi:hypothetical protein
MANVVYKSLSSLSPIELKYQYHRDEKIINTPIHYAEGYRLYETNAFAKYKDVAINKNSCFILTSAIDLEEVFEQDEDTQFNKQPSTVILQPRNSVIYYTKHNPTTNTFQLALTSSSYFFIQPINNTQEVEIYVDKKYVQVDEEYPFTVRLGDRSLDPESIYRQRFYVYYEDDFISLRTKTSVGDRYLAFNNDNILRCTGLVFNNYAPNDYIFKCLPITDIKNIRGFIPTNNWATYYFDVESQTENKTVTINKDFQSVPTNFLFDFPIEQAIETGIAEVNIANLKTQVTPTGGPAPVDNSYTKNVITKN